MVYADYVRMHEILPYLYLGDCFYDVEYLQQRGIKHVLNVSDEIILERITNTLSSYTRIPIQDVSSENLLCHLDQICDIIQSWEDKGEVGLVHCMAGVSRSSSAVIAYIMKRYNWNYNKAYEFVKGIRPCISPNHGFVRQLKFYGRRKETPIRLGVIMLFGVCSLLGVYYFSNATAP
jgi:protein-tyrosine phosphatase